MNARFDVVNGVMKQMPTGRYVEYGAHEETLRNLANAVVARFEEIEAGATAGDAAKTLKVILSFEGVDWAPKS